MCPCLGSCASPPCTRAAQIIYDGSCVLHDTMAVLFRTLDDDGVTIVQQVVCFRFLGKPINGDTLAKLLNEITNMFGIAPDDVRGWMHDRSAATCPRSSRACHTPTLTGIALTDALSIQARKVNWRCFTRKLLTYRVSHTPSTTYVHVR
jgi:hypothetical protein